MPSRTCPCTELPAVVSGHLVRLAANPHPTYPTSNYSPTPPAMAEPIETYHPVDSLANTARTTLQTGAVGATIAGVMSALQKQNIGATGIITRFGGVIALYGMDAIARRLSGPV
jgi:hypothetical protein